MKGGRGSRYGPRLTLTHACKAVLAIAATVGHTHSVRVAADIVAFALCASGPDCMAGICWYACNLI